MDHVSMPVHGALLTAFCFAIIGWWPAATIFAGMSAFGLWFGIMRAIRRDREAEAGARKAKEESHNAEENRRLNLRVTDFHAFEERCIETVFREHGYGPMQLSEFKAAFEHLNEAQPDVELYLHPDRCSMTLQRMRDKGKVLYRNGVWEWSGEGALSVNRGSPTNSTF